MFHKTVRGFRALVCPSFLLCEVTFLMALKHNFSSVLAVTTHQQNGLVFIFLLPMTEV